MRSIKNRSKTNAAALSGSCSSGVRCLRARPEFHGSDSGKKRHRLRSRYVLKPCLAVVRQRSDEDTAVDIEGKMPLHVAVEVSNIHAIKWYFSLGLHIQQEDVSCLLRLNRLTVVQDVLLHQLERRDVRVYHARQQDGPDYDSKCGWDLGVGILACAELERVQAGPRDGHAASFLLDAAKYGHLKSVELLLRQGTNPRMCDPNGWTALHVSITFLLCRKLRSQRWQSEPFWRRCARTKGQRATSKSLDCF